MDFSTIIIIGVVIFVVIGVFRSIAKAKKKARARQEAMNSQDGSPQTSGQQQSQYAPPQNARASAMSDIQRAFAMMGELEDEEKPKPPPARVQPKPQAAPRPIAARAPAPYTSVQGKSTFASGMQPHEGIVGKTEGRATTHEGKHGKTEGRATTHEGKAGKTEGIEFHGKDAHVMPNAYTGIDLTSVSVDLGEDDFGNSIADMNARPKAEPMKLFENQSDYMKAVIFSEILPRRSR